MDRAVILVFWVCEERWEIEIVQTTAENGGGNTSYDVGSFNGRSSRSCDKCDLPTYRIKTTRIWFALRVAMDWYAHVQCNSSSISLDFDIQWSRFPLHMSNFFKLLYTLPEIRTFNFYSGTTLPCCVNSVGFARWKEGTWRKRDCSGFSCCFLVFFCLLFFIIVLLLDLLTCPTTFSSKYSVSFLSLTIHIVLTRFIMTSILHHDFNSSSWLLFSLPYMLKEFLEMSQLLVIGIASDCIHYSLCM